jgi:hypothetical protein
VPDPWRFRVAAQPSFADLVLMVFGKGDEVIAVLFAPAGDRFGEIVAVTRKEVHVLIALIPAISHAIPLIPCRCPRP